MKNHTGVISNSCFPKPYAKQTCRRCTCGKVTIRKYLENQAKKWWPTIAATGSIGTIVASSIYFYLVQLAEHGF